MITALEQHELRSIREGFARLYPQLVDRCVRRFATLSGRYGVGYPASADPRAWSEKDAVLIAYGDMVQAPDERPLFTLRRFLKEFVGDAVNTLHILPFFPYSSDDGFSVIHFRTVSPELGNWTHIQDLATDYRLMADLVLNHVSRQSGWFRDFETEVAPGRDYFIAVDAGTDLSQVVRPRTHPLLTKAYTRSGIQHVWTTFSEDQVDLNFGNPDVFFELLDILVFYVSMGARVIRLDAIAYLWKQIGTTCIHLPETHQVVKLYRSFLEIVAPDVWLLTETNVPHEENVSYFGNGDEAHMVYQFSLPPLTLHAMVNGHARYLSDWAAKLAPPPPGCTFLNFTASHDGVGVRPLQGLIPPEELAALQDHVLKHGGRVSMKKNADGSESPYELNIAWYEAMGLAPDEDPELHLRRFISSQAISMTLQGIPALYFHSLTASPNDEAGMKRTGQARSLNRHKWQYSELAALMQSKEHRTPRAFAQLKALLSIRARSPAFHPDAPQKILGLDDRLFAVERRSLDGAQRIIAVTNCSGDSVRAAWPDGGKARELISDKSTALRDGLSVAPYETLWLEIKS